MKQFSDELTPVGGLQPLGGGAPTPVPVESSSAANEPTKPDTAHRSVRPEPYHGATYPSHHAAIDPPSKIPYYLLGGGVVAAAIGAVFFVVPSTPVNAPAEWQPFTAADKSFACEIPKSWDVTAMGKASAANELSVEDGVIAKRSDAKVEVTVSSITGLITGQLLYGNDPIPAGTFQSRSAPIFRAHGRQFKKRFAHYQEVSVAPTNVMYPRMTNVVMGKDEKDLVADIRWGEYTATGNNFGMGGKRHGYRMAVGGNKYIVYVICECSERDWTKLKPAFERTIASVREIRPPGGSNIALPGGASLPMGGEVPGFGASGFGTRP